MNLPAMFSTAVVFSSCVHAISVILLTPGSVAASIGPRATSTRLTMNLPPFELSRLSLRKRSAHSTTLSAGGGVSPFGHERARLAVSEVGLGLAELGEMLLDMRGQDRGERASVDAKFIGHIDRDPRRPRQPGVAEIARGVEEQGFGGGAIDQLARLFRERLFALKAKEVLLAADRLGKREVRIVGIVFASVVQIVSVLRRGLGTTGRRGPRRFEGLFMLRKRPRRAMGHAAAILRRALIEVPLRLLDVDPSVVAQHEQAVTLPDGDGLLAHASAAANSAYVQNVLGSLAIEPLPPTRHQPAVTGFQRPRASKGPHISSPLDRT